MTHVYELSTLELSEPSVVSIGVFDGVHLGHQALIRQLVTEAHSTDRLAVVLTFFPHPDVALHNITGRYYLMDAETRARYLLSLGVDYVVTHPFNDEIRHIRAADFVDRLLTYLKLTELWVGEDFAMGYKREGDIAFLKDQAQRKGFSVNIVNMIQAETGLTISSSIIRQALQEGRVEDVRDWLGRSYSITGRVVGGEKRGKQLGFPTANLEIWEQQMIPMKGVYACFAYIDGGHHMAMTNVGVSPTFGEKEVTVEPHLLDFDQEIYGKEIRLTFEKFIRPEKKFTGIEELKTQIQDDIEEGRKYLMSIID